MVRSFILLALHFGHTKETVNINVHTLVIERLVEIVEQKNMCLEVPTVEKNLKCRRCGRKLKNPESIEIGFGVICYQKYQNRKKLIPLFTMPKKEEIDEMDAKMAKELAAKTEKVKRLETKVQNLKKSNKVKERVIQKIVERLIPGGKDVSAQRTALVRELMEEVEKREC